MSSDVATRTNGMAGSESSILWCKEESRSKRLMWDIKGETLCGRPLGLRLLGRNVSTSALFFTLSMRAMKDVLTFKIVQLTQSSPSSL